MLVRRAAFAMTPWLLVLLPSCAADAPPPVPPVAALPAPAPSPAPPPSTPPVPVTTSIQPATPPPSTPPAVATEPAAGPPARGPISVGGAAGNATLVGDQLSVSLSDRSVFGQTCNDAGRVSVKSGGVWKPVPRDLPPKGNYVLDGKYVGYGMCDGMVCGSPHFNVQLRQFQPSSDPSGRTAYTSSPVTGTIKVEFTYFADSGCKTPRTLAVTLER